MHHRVLLKFRDDPGDRIGVAAEHFQRRAGVRGSIREPVPGAAEDRARIRMGGQVQLPADLVRIQEVVGVQELEELALGQAQPGVTGGARPAVGLGLRPDPPRLEPPGNLWTFIGGAVVDHDDLGRDASLRQG